MNDLTTAQLECIQREFAHQFMDRDGVIGARVRRTGDSATLVVTVAPEYRDSLQLPTEFNGLTVQLVDGAPAVLAYTIAA